jgi:hypothetical protein
MDAFRAFALPVAALSIIGSSCSSYQQQAGLIGGLAGDGRGSATGDSHQDGIAGAAAIHEQGRRRDYERYGIPPDEPHEPYQQGEAQNQELGPGADPDPLPRYPLAMGTSNPDEVESPFPPNHRINISGFSSGQLAKDPKNGKIFQIP